MGKPACKEDTKSMWLALLVSLIFQSDGFDLKIAESGQTVRMVLQSRADPALVYPLYEGRTMTVAIFAR